MYIKNINDINSVYFIRNSEDPNDIEAFMVNGKTIMNAESNEDVKKVREWLTLNGRPVPHYSSEIIKD